MNDETGRMARNPYIERQEVMEAMLRSGSGHASAFRPDRRPNGVIRIASPTGSGKNHVVQRFVAGLLNEGISRRPRADGGMIQTFSGVPSRSWVVLVIPEKANRNTNAKAIRGMLGDSDLAHRVVRLESNEDSLSSYVASYGPVNPFAQLGDKDLDQAWENAVRALREYRESSGVSNEGIREFMRLALEDGERRLRGAVRRCRVGIDLLGLRDVVARVWPAARILTAGAGVLILTPQKLLNVVDTVLGPRSLDLTSPGFAERAIYVCDEGDRQKREWLDAMISSHMRYDVFEVMSDLYDQFVDEASPVRGVVTGDQGAWVRILNSKKVAGGSTVWAAMSQPKRADFLKRVDAVARSYGLASKAVIDAVTGTHARLQLVLSDASGLPMQDARSRWLFSESSVNVSVPNVGKRRLGLAPDESGDFCMLSLLKTDTADASLDKALRRLNGVMGIWASHLMRVSYLLHDANGKSPDDFEALNDEMRSALNASRIPDEYHGIYLSLMRGKRDRKRSRGPMDGDYEDPTPYARGVGYVELLDSPDHALQTKVYSDRIQELPEHRLSSIAERAPVFLMSATIAARSVQNWDWEYLEERGVLNDMERENARLVDLSEQVMGLPVNDVKVSFVTADVQTDPLAPIAQQGPRTAWDVVFGPDSLSSKVASGLEAKGGLSDYARRRLIKLCVAAARFFSDASTRHVAGLALTTRDVRGSVDDGAFLAETLGAFVCGLPDATERLGDDPRQAIAFLNASCWEDERRGWPQVRRRLEQGRPTLVFAPYASGGFSKNPDYIPDGEQVARLMRLEYGYDPGPACTVDLDFMYLEDPTHRLESSISDAIDPDRSARALRAVVEREELYELGESTRWEVDMALDTYFKGHASMRNRDLPSNEVEGSKYVGQGVGRCTRSMLRMPSVTILVDEDIPASCDFSWLLSQPRTRELDMVARLCEQRRKMPHSSDRERLLARKNARADSYADSEHKRLLARVMAGADGSLDAFDERRRQKLRSFAAKVSMLRGEQLNRRFFSIETGVRASGYAWVSKPEELFIAPIPADGSASGEGVLARLKSEHPSFAGSDGLASYGIVSQDEARLPELMMDESVRSHFVEHGFETELVTGDLFMTPSDFQQEYLGALGEEALLAVLERPLARAGLRLTRGPDSKAERGGDFLVLRDDGESTDVWIDSKHFSLESYVTGRWLADIDEPARYEGKARSVGARGIVVVNVLAPDNPSPFDSRPVGRRAWSVPWVIASGRVSNAQVDEVLRRVSEFMAVPRAEPDEDRLD